MNPTTIPGANRVLKAPRDWDEAKHGECVSLPVIDTGNSFQSAWLPSVDELDAMQKGGAVILTIWGRHLPPAAIGVSAPPGYVAAEHHQQALAMLRALVFAARTSGGTAGPDVELMRACEMAERIVGPVDPQQPMQRPQ